MRLQGRIEGRGSGGAFFSADGPVEVAVKTGVRVIAATINEVLVACAAGNCARNGRPIDLAPWSRQYEETLQPPKSYAEEGFHEDAGLVTACLDGLPHDVRDRSGQDGCRTYERRKMTHLEIAAGGMKLTMREVIRRARCGSLRDLCGNRVTECSAGLDSLNSAIRNSPQSDPGIPVHGRPLLLMTAKYGAELHGGQRHPGSANPWYRPL